MTIWGVIPSIRVQDMPAAFAFYTETLGFEATRGTPEDVNVALHRGDAHLMIESPTDFYSPEYNEAIRERLGNPPSMSLYIEATDLDDLYERVQRANATIVDPLAPRDWGQREFTVADPEGNWLTFWKALA